MIPAILWWGEIVMLHLLIVLSPGCLLCLTTWSLISKRTLVALPQGMDGYQHKPIHNSFSFSAYCWCISFPIICHEWDGKFLFLLLVCCWFISSPIRGWESLFLHLFLIYCCFSSVPNLNGKERIPLPPQPIVGLHPLSLLISSFYIDKSEVLTTRLWHIICVYLLFTLVFLSVTQLAKLVNRLVLVSRNIVQRPKN